MKVLSLAIVFALACAASAFGQKTKKVPASKPNQKAGASASTAKCPGSGLTETEVADILSAHNAARAVVKQSALKWDCGLASAAQSWANKGSAGHNEFSPYGENVFVASDGAAQVSLATQQWLSEKANWTNRVGRCAPGKTCTHYVQMVWSSTRSVGCGINRNIVGARWKTMLVCNYDIQSQDRAAYPE